MDCKVSKCLLWVCFFKTNEDWFLTCKLERIRKQICVSLLNKSIQDLSDHGASKEPKNLLPEFRKEMQNSFLDSFGFKNQMLDFLK